MIVFKWLLAMLYIYEVALIPFLLSRQLYLVDVHLDAVCCMLYQQIFLPFLLSYPTANERL